MLRIRVNLVAIHHHPSRLTMVAVGAGLARDGTHHEVRSRARPAPTFSVSSGRSGFAVLNSYTRSLDVVAKG